MVFASVLSSSPLPVAVARTSQSPFPLYAILWKPRIKPRKFINLRRNLFLLSFLTLLCGTLIYLLFRVSTLKVFSWLNFLGIDFVNFDLRKNSINFAPKIPEWFIFSLPDGIWIFSYVVLMISIWNFNVNKQSLFWLAIIPIIAIFSEIFQIFGIISGTFDIIDLSFYLLGFILPFVIFRKQLNYNFLTLWTKI